MADDPDPLERRPELRLPVRQQVAEDRIQALLRRIPGLHQVVIEPDVVDRPDGGLGIGVGRQQDALGGREKLDGLAEELDAGHLRHALIRQEQRNGIVAELQLAQGIERSRAGIGAQDAVVLAVLAPQVSLDRGKDDAIVVYGENGWLGHDRSLPSPMTHTVEIGCRTDSRDIMYDNSITNRLVNSSMDSTAQGGQKAQWSSGAKARQRHRLLSLRMPGRAVSTQSIWVSASRQVSPAACLVECCEASRDAHHANPVADFAEQSYNPRTKSCNSWSPTCHCTGIINEPSRDRKSGHQLAVPRADLPFPPRRRRHHE